MHGEFYTYNIMSNSPLSASALKYCTDHNFNDGTAYKLLDSSLTLQKVGMFMVWCKEHIENMKKLSNAIEMP